jgi:hypothetical protein
VFPFAVDARIPACYPFPCSRATYRSRHPACSEAIHRRLACRKAIHRRLHGAVSHVRLPQHDPRRTGRRRGVKPSARLPPARAAALPACRRLVSDHGRHLRAQDALCQRRGSSLAPGRVAQRITATGPRAHGSRAEPARRWAGPAGVVSFCGPPDSQWGPLLHDAKLHPLQSRQASVCHGAVAGALLECALVPGT